MARRYELRRRAERQADTRRRIVEAAVALHQRRGLADTTITDIAEFAGVGRQTVYRHFPDEFALTQACSGLYGEHHPPPDLERWRAIAAPRERFRTALRESYAYHRRTEPMMGRMLAEAESHPAMRAYHEHWRRAADVVAAAWRLGGRRRTLLRAAVGHALAFPTWQSLVRGQGLTDQQAVEVALRLVADELPRPQVRRARRS
jgi:AcrR family transcriptional regulator